MSALLRLAGIDVKMTLGAGRLAERLGGSSGESRLWVRILVGEQKAGDVGVTFDEDKNKPVADHIYLVVRRVDTDEMVVADNQGEVQYSRYASGRGKTPTEFFLRARPRAQMVPNPKTDASAEDDIMQLAADSSLARYHWSQRGRAPRGYI